MIQVLALAAAIVVTGAYSHPATDTAAVYFEIGNAGPSDTLLGAQSSVAASTTVHKSMPTGSMSGMQGGNGEMMVPVATLPIPAGSTVRFKPGGFHVMLEHLKRTLKAGDTFVLRLHFARAGWIDVPVTVKPY